MSDFAAWGDPARFEIAVRWIEDDEPRERRPAHGGWSTGELRLTVGHQVLTRRVQAGAVHDAARWYLLPVFEWLATNWVFLLHEERFAWRENSIASAAPAVLVALDRSIGAFDPAGRQRYEHVHAWWSRHALRAADPSALYPDVALRRLGDDVEVSWTARQPVHTPDGFRLELVPGAAILPVADVAGPLWEALAWSVAMPPALAAADRRSLEALDAAITELAALPTAALESGYVPQNLLSRLKTAESAAALSETGLRMERLPAISRFDDAVLMFGGVNPDIDASDTSALVSFMSAQRGGAESDELAMRVRTDIGPPLMAPFEEGYGLAEDLLDEFDLPDGTSTMIDVWTMVEDLGIRIAEEKLATSTIRGVALAGEAYAPAILINLSSSYNRTPAGKRFTLAHELFHILYDRTRARRVAHSSGPWAPAGVEKRANAFAAMLLMPPALVRRVHRDNRWTSRSVAKAAIAMNVGASALTEHLYNTALIDELERDQLRAGFRRST